MPKVLISDSMSPRAADIFRERGIEVDEKTGLSKEELIEIIGDYDGLAIRSSTRPDAEIMAAAKNLKVIGRAGIGVDNVDINAATQNGIVVMNTPFGNAITTAEHAIAMMFAVSRQIPEANASTHAGKWEKKRFMGVELTAKTLGVIGCGNIGAIAAERAIGLKMRVVAFDPFLSEERAKEIGVEKVELDDLLARADFITLHTPLTDQTRNILNAESLAKTKKGVRIINCARGGLVDENALADALKSGHVAGAAFDVFVEEPAKENVLFDLPNVVCTPHLGASTTEAQVNVALQVAEQMADYLLTGAVTNAINMPSVSAEDAPKLAPYMALAEALGGFAGQITETGLKAIEVEFEGAVADLNIRPLVAVALKGLLSPLSDSVNMVNAPAMAKERGIEISETRTEAISTDHPSLIKITVQTERQTRTVSGTVVAGGAARITEVNGVPLEAAIGQQMLYIVNQDKPGLIGHLGMALSDAAINIATFHLGRKEEGGEAVSLVHIDQQAPADIVAKIAAIDGVETAKGLSFAL